MELSQTLTSMARYRARQKRQFVFGLISGMFITLILMNAPWTKLQPHHMTEQDTHYRMANMVKKYSQYNYPFSKVGHQSRGIQNGLPKPAPWRDNTFTRNEDTESSMSVDDRRTSSENVDPQEGLSDFVEMWPTPAPMEEKDSRTGEDDTSQESSSNFVNGLSRMTATMDDNEKRSDKVVDSRENLSNSLNGSLTETPMADSDHTANMNISLTGRLSNSAGKKCVKSVHINADMDQLAHSPELTAFKASVRRDSFIRCTPDGYQCDITLSISSKLNELVGKDAVIFGMNGPQWRRNNLLEELLKVDPEPSQTWVYYSTEPPYRLVRWSETTDIARLKYHVLMTYNQEADIHIPFGYYQPFSETAIDSTSIKQAMVAANEVLHRNRSSGLISWVASNCRDVFWPRMALVRRLKELMPLDDYGACGHVECLPKRSTKCNQFFASYKFYLAVPNSECNDYISEKFWDISLKTGVVPVVIGAKKGDYERVAPPNSYIHAGDFESLRDLADYLKKVDANDELYASYHEWRRKGKVVIPYPPKATALCRILPHMRSRTKEDIKLIGDSAWYRGCREMPSRDNFKKPMPRTLNNWTVWR